MKSARKMLRVKFGYFLIGLMLLITVFVISLKEVIPRYSYSLFQYIQGKKTVAERVEQQGEIVRQRLLPDFERVGVSYPPERITLVGLKQEKLLEVWVGNESEQLKLLKTNPILGAGGGLGPKLKQGDGQVPEGFYRIESLNPNSRFHLALRVNYPNSFDKDMAKQDGRKNLGGDIMIHGGTASIGCLAMGDRAAEDLFVLAANSGISDINVILSPVDFRVRELPEELPDLPDWTKELHLFVKGELLRLN
jgi:hypothetical protein